MALRPASMFACGCSLQFGVVVILTFHLAACLAYLATSFSHIVLHSSVFSSGLSNWDPVWQFSMIGFIMAGVPLILLALYGVAKRMDVAVRLYLGYLLLTFVIDSVALVYMFLWTNGGECGAPGSILHAFAADVGQAFMCGFFRIFAYVFVAVAICAEVYCLFVVWSFCEDVHEGASGPGLWELLPGKEVAFQKKQDSCMGERWSPYADIVGLAHADLPGAYPNPYGTLDRSRW